MERIACGNSGSTGTVKLREERICHTVKKITLYYHLVEGDFTLRLHNNHYKRFWVKAFYLCSVWVRERKQILR